MTKRRVSPPHPPKSRKPALPKSAVRPHAISPVRPARAARPPAPKRQIARIVDEDEATLLDLIDNLLGKGVMLNAELVLALADVDLVYVRLSALLCAADRVLRP
jgi:hypothetical protein